MHRFLSKSLIILLILFATVTWGRKKECEWSRQCPNGKKCHENFCFTPCKSVGDCPRGLICRRETCLEEKCFWNEDCRGDEICLADLCHKLCESTEGCPSPLICEDGICTNGTACSGNSNCSRDTGCSGDDCYQPIGTWDTSMTVYLVLSLLLVLVVFCVISALPLSYWFASCCTRCCQPGSRAARYTFSLFTPQENLPSSGSYPQPFSPDSYPARLYPSDSYPTKIYSGY